MDITEFDRDQLKDIIRENRDRWGDAPDLTVSEKEMEEYLQAKLDSGELKLGNVVGDENPEGSGDPAADALQAAADAASDEDDDDNVEIKETQETAVNEEEERQVEVSLLREVFLEDGVRTPAKFDSDGVPTVKATMGISQAKKLQKAGAVNILG